MSWHLISHNRIIPTSLDQEMQATTRHLSYSGCTAIAAKMALRDRLAENNAQATRFRGFGADSRGLGPFRANAVGEFPRVNPGLSFLGHFGPQMPLRGMTLD